LKKLLYISHRPAYPPDKGERVRAYHQIRQLSGAFEVTLATLLHGPDEGRDLGPLPTWCKRVIVAQAAGRMGVVRHPLRLARGASLTELWFTSRPMDTALADLCRQERFDVVMGYCSSVLPYLRTPLRGGYGNLPAPVRVLDLVDIDSAKWLSYASAARGPLRWPMRWLYRRETAAVAKLERETLDHCQAVFVTSDAEAALLARDAGVPPSQTPAERHDVPLWPAQRGRDARDTNNVHVVGNGVDSDYFTPGLPVGDDHPSIVFTGTMDYRPNAEAVCWFASDVWPALRRDWPTLQWNIVGRDPLPAVRVLAKLPGVNVTGSVPDVRPFLRTASLAVVPLRTARGIQNKILEAMSAGLPVAATSETLKGITARVGEEVFQADEPSQWIACVSALLKDAPRRAAAGQAARARILEHYAWPAQLKPMVSLIENLADANSADAHPDRAEDDHG